MADVRALEATVNRDIKNASAEDLDMLARHYWQAALGESDYRTKQKLLKRSSHFAGHAFNKGTDCPETLRLYMDIVRLAAQVHSFPQDERRKLAQITASWLTLTGAGKHSLLARIKGKVITETATFGLGDVGITPDPMGEPWSEAQMVDWMSKGQRLFFGTGYDGAIKAELRVIDGIEPVLLPKEYETLKSSTPPMVLAAPSGRIALADYSAMLIPWAGESPDSALVIEAPTGKYKTCAFGFSTSKWDSVVAVLCRTEESPPNAIGAVDSLFA